MAVADTTTIDQVARDEHGRVLLAMTEERRYAHGSQESMVEEFRQKLNNYVYVIRSGQLREIVGDQSITAIDIQLFCADAPPDLVQEMITTASEALAVDGVRVGWEVRVPSVDDCLTVIGRTLADRAPTGWSRIELSASVVGDGLAGGLVAVSPSGEETPLDPDTVLVSALQDLKRARWSPEQGTWLTFRATITGQQIQPFFDHEHEPPGGAGGFKPVDWAEELRRFPRAVVPDWWQAQLAG